jgi:aldose 1-epimerase
MLSEQSRTSLLTLTAGDLVVDLAPEIGGSVASFRTHRAGNVVNLMRPMSEEAKASRHPGGAAMFPMVPYANRIAGNRFDFDGHTYQFKQNVPHEPFTIHGTGWQAAWTVAAANTTSAELNLDHLASDEPYSYSAVQRFRLTPDRLVVMTGVTNRADRTMPFGFCYAGWDGRAEITFPHSGVGLRIDASPLFRHLMFYCDPAKTFFCVEPQTHSTGALNRLANNVKDDLGVLLLKPGESAEAEISFTQFQI